MLTSAREYKWSAKDGNRIEWSITAEEAGKIYSSDYYKTEWNVVVTGDAMFRFEFSLDTQYDKPVKLKDIWFKYQKYMDSFTCVILTKAKQDACSVD